MTLTGASNNFTRFEATEPLGTEHLDSPKQHWDPSRVGVKVSCLSGVVGGVQMVFFEEL